MADVVVKGSPSRVTSLGRHSAAAIADHPLIAFFVFAFAFSWAFWLLIPPTNDFYLFGVFGPLLAAVVVSTILAPERIAGSLSRRLALFACVFVAAFAAWVLLKWQLYEDRNWVEGAALSAMAGLLISGPLAGRRGAHDLISSLTRWRVGWSSYAALILGPAIMLSAVGIDLALGGKLPAWPYGAPTLDLVVIGFVWILFYGGGLEEPGWRGFALPRLQGRWSPLVASAILGFFWGLWHAPEYFNGFYTATSNTGLTGVPGLLIRFVWVIPLALIFTWVYNHARGSILILVLLHAAFNTPFLVVGLSSRAGLLMVFGTVWALALALLLIGRMWRRLPASAALIDERST